VVDLGDRVVCAPLGPEPIGDRLKVTPTASRAAGRCVASGDNLRWAPTTTPRDLELAIEQGRADAREVLRAPAQIAWRTSELA
jgi:hypothetical protein